MSKYTVTINDGTVTVEALSVDVTDNGVLKFWGEDSELIHSFVVWSSFIKVDIKGSEYD